LHNHFCSICKCRRAREGYGTTDYNSWERRTKEEYEFYSHKFVNATDAKDRQAIFNEAGVQWTELQRLPYFDPTRFVVVDAMHNLFLGLIKEHFLGILGIRLQKPAGEVVINITLSNNLHALSQNEQKTLQKLKKWLEAPMNHKLQSNRTSIHKKFMRCHKRSLAFVCCELGLDLTRTLIKPRLPRNIGSTPSLTG